MFVYLVCLLVIINAFGPEEVMAQGGCADRLPPNVCQQFKAKGNCENPFFEIPAQNCMKTCGKCT
ncbi:shTK domain protein [Ancylostoma caninum]|uniref:ShTK domain protein n=1 Tax=Ancylostoma caninum TaxID=29170 RepID=A0A368FSZ0_ANCCA|nr:shTK domain protein [Ancylostoma caninum]